MYKYNSRRHQSLKEEVGLVKQVELEFLIYFCIIQFCIISDGNEIN